MRIQYFSDTDTLYINLAERPAAETETVTDDVIVDLDSSNKVVGITIDNYSKHAEMTEIEAVDLPLAVKARFA